MKKFISILVPYYNEGESIVRHLLDSIAVQQNFDLDGLEVIICKDGDEGQDLSQEFLDQVKMQISSGIRQREVIQGMEMEIETLDQFLKSIKEVS